MDILFWKNLSPNIQVQSSVKQFYKQYFYKLDIFAPGCKSIRSDNIAHDVNKRQAWVRDYRRQGSWYNERLYNHLKHADIGLLTSLKCLYYEYPDIKIRCEEPRISVYALDEAMIQSVAKSIDPGYQNNIESITGPANEELKKVLKSNTILVKKPPKYRYRVWFKEKQFGEQPRQQVYNYLKGLGDLVRMTDHTKESLSKPHDWIWGCYFYTNDMAVATFITLIHPDFVREVSELVCVNNK